MLKEIDLESFDRNTPIRTHVNPVHISASTSGLLSFYTDEDEEQDYAQPPPPTAQKK